MYRLRASVILLLYFSWVNGLKKTVKNTSVRACINFVCLLVCLSICIANPVNAFFVHPLAYFSYFNVLPGLNRLFLPILFSSQI